MVFRLSLQPIARLVPVAARPTVTAEFGLPGVETKSEMEQGEVIRKVLDKSRGADLVVVGGKTSRRIWAKGLLGAKTQEITDRVAGNVLIVRSADAAKGNNWFGRMLIQLRRYVQPE
jgi:nucleotide-binding universal stress UspA family protein